MMRFAIFSLTIVCLCVDLSLCRLNRHDLEAAVSAFDGYVDSNKAKKIEAEPEVYEVDARSLQRPGPAVEEAAVKKEAYCIGCPYNLDTTNPDIIKMATDSLGIINDGYRYTYLNLVKATAEVQNVLVYNLKVDVNRCFGDGLCSNASCILELRYENSQPKLAYTQCVDV